MLFQYIEHLRKKPHHTRKRFAFLITVCVTGVVVAIWSLTLPARLASITIKGSDLVGGAGTEALSDQLQQGKNNIQEVIETGSALSQDFSEESFEGYDIRAGANRAGVTGATTTGSATIPSSETPREEWVMAEVKKVQKVLIATSTRGDSETIR